MTTSPDHPHPAAAHEPEPTPASWLRQFIVTAIGAMLVVMGIALTITEWLVTRSADGLTFGIIVFVAGVAFLLAGALAGRRRTQWSAALMAATAVLAMGLALRAFAGAAVTWDATYTALSLATVAAVLVAIVLLCFVVEKVVERRGRTMFTARGVFASLAMGSVGPLLRALGSPLSPQATSHFDSAAWHLLTLVILLWPTRVRPDA